MFAVKAFQGSKEQSNLYALFGSEPEAIAYCIEHYHRGHADFFKVYDTSLPPTEGPVKEYEEGEWYDMRVDENDSPFSEYEQGWRNIRADEAAAVARQNKENKHQPVTYMGIVGRFEPDGGYIFEP